MDFDVSVILTTWNSRRLIGTGLRSLRAQEGVRTELIAVDNGSSDGTQEVIRCEAPSAHLICLPTNYGPAMARNLAIRQTRGRYVLTMDHDVELAPGFLQTIVVAADASSPQVGMWSGQVLRPDRRTIDSTGIVLTRTWRAFDHGSGTSALTPMERRTGILGPSSCAAFYRRAMLEDIREGPMYFDERFFFLWEDVELAWRAVQRGWQARYVPEAVCYHIRNGSLLSRRLRQAFSFRNRYLFIQKHQLWRPIHHYIWHCGLYDVMRLGLIALINPRALRLGVEGLLRCSSRRP